MSNNIVRVTRGNNCFILIGTHNGRDEQVSIPDSEFRGCFYKYQMDFFYKFKSAFPKATAFELMPEAGRALKQIMEFNRIDS